MTERLLMPDDVRARARVRYDRMWRDWASGLAVDGKLRDEPELAVNLHPPREGDLASPADIVRAREWVAAWRDVSLDTLGGKVRWERRSWSRVGAQEVPCGVKLVSADAISRWAGRAGEWEVARNRMLAVAGRVLTPHGAWPPCPAPDLRAAARASAKAWCALDEVDWRRCLAVLDWLLAHPDSHPFARQLPIRGIDTKWIERHAGALRPVYRAIIGSDFGFAAPGRLFRCFACSPSVEIGGCTEFALVPGQLARLAARPRAVVICENLVNVLCLGETGREIAALGGVLAVHGGGYAVAELAAVPWLAEVPLVYWGDLDSNGFAILDIVRGFVPQAKSALMDVETLEHHLDLCVEEPTPASGSFARLAPDEQAALFRLREGDSSRGIASLRLEQERIEWPWALSRLECLLSQNGIKRV